MLTVVPLQMVAVLALVMTGTGFTVTVTTKGIPLQPAAPGVIVYAAVPGEAPVAVSVCAIFAPEAPVAPLTPDCETVQV